MGVPYSGMFAIVNALASFVAGADDFRAEDSSKSSASGHCTAAVRHYKLFGPNPKVKSYGCEVVLWDMVGGSRE